MIHLLMTPTEIFVVFEYIYRIAKNSKNHMALLKFSILLFTLMSGLLANLNMPSFKINTIKIFNGALLEISAEQ